METHISLTPSDCGIMMESTVLCEQIRVIDKTRIKRKVGEIVDKQIIKNIDRVLMISLGIGVL